MKSTIKLALPGTSLCSGCGACAAVCARGAIAMRTDHEGFRQPVVEATKCVGCGRCAAVCPVNHPAAARTPRSVWAAQAVEDEVRRTSSSGGVFTLLARKVLADGGVVFGAALDAGLTVRHVEVGDAAGLASLRGSKYVQSDLGDAFAKVRERLCAGRRVMFVGTPCQTAGLGAFLKATLGGAYDGCRERLLVVSVICHAAPSPLAWRAYLAGESVRSAVTAVAFRDKARGWKAYCLKVTHADGTVGASGCGENPFLRAFLSELCNRRSCARCASRELRTDDDLTLGDYWRVAERFPDFDDDRGTSLVLVNSERGERAWRAIAAEVRVRASDWEHAKEVNPALVRSTEGKKRVKFSIRRFVDSSNGVERVERVERGERGLRSEEKFEREERLREVESGVEKLRDVERVEREGRFERERKFEKFERLGGEVESGVEGVESGVEGVERVERVESGLRGVWKWMVRMGMEAIGRVRGRESFAEEVERLLQPPWCARMKVRMARVKNKGLRGLRSLRG